MSASLGKKRSLRGVGVLLAGLAVFLSSCGTILYPERRGQPAGRLDAGVVALNGVGLLLFLVPGVIAFAVDFATGAIYLPPEMSHLGPQPGTKLREVHVEPSALTRERIEKVVSEQAGKAVSLRPDAYRARQLQKLDEFTAETVADLKAADSAAPVRFRGNDEP